MATGEDRLASGCLTRLRERARSRIRSGLTPQPLAQVLREHGEALWIPDPAPPGRLRPIVIASEAMLELLEILVRVADSLAIIFFRGGSGTGKGLLARLAHLMSSRWDRPFVEVHLGSLCESVIESELFGHDRGAFTGADREKPGRIELAEGGTLFLDEVGDVPLPVQAKLLRLLQDRVYERVGSSQTIVADVRFMAATNRDPEELVGAGRFREDLYYRLNIVPVRVASLDERREEIPALVRALLEELSAHHGRPAPIMASGTLEALASHPLRGNVRDLRAILERMLLLHEAREVAPEDIDKYVAGSDDMPAARADRILSIDEAVGLHIKKVIDLCHGDVDEAAGKLRVARSTLYKKIHKHNLDV